MNTSECRKMIRDLSQTAQIVKRGNIDPSFAIELCTGVMTKTAVIMLELLKELEAMEDDLK